MISFIFVICTLPISIRALISDFFPEYKTTTRWQITQLCLTLLMYLNHTVKDFFFCKILIEKYFIFRLILYFIV